MRALPKKICEIIGRNAVSIRKINENINMIITNVKSYRQNR